MSKKLPIVLIVGGLVIGGLSWLGYQQMNKKSDDEILMDAAMDLMQQQRHAEEERSTLMTKVLSAPEECEGVKTAIVFQIIEGEPDIGKDWPDWTDFATPKERRCIMTAFHQTNEHAFRIQGKEYKRRKLDINRTSKFISEVATAALFTDGVSFGDEDSSLVTLIDGYFADRATSRTKPGYDY